MMKKILTIIAVFSLLAACSKPDGGETAKIVFAQNPLILPCDSGTYDLGMDCNAAWTSSTQDSWITLLNTSGLSGEDIKIRIASNSTDADRYGQVVVSSGKTSKKLSICQQGNLASGFVSTTSLTFQTIESVLPVSVTSNVAWEISEISADWFSVEKLPSRVEVTCQVNYTGEERLGSFTVSTVDKSRTATIAVRQAFDNSRFLASTVYGRKLVYAAGKYFVSVSSDSYTEVTDGLGSFEMTCTYTDGYAGEKSPFQRKIFLFEIDLTKLSILATLSDDKVESLAEGKLQTIRNQLTALQASRPSITVWGGTNGDFYVTSTNALHGVMYRGGNCLKDTFLDKVCTVFAVLKDGTACCLTQSEYPSYRDKIAEAVGGRQNLLENGVKVNFTDPALEPRTAAGVSQDGKTAYLLIVDGRDTQYKTGSYGASYDALARILYAAGAYEAINLDGGGSSSYLVRKDNGFELRNKPGNSGNSERAVINGLAIIKK